MTAITGGEVEVKTKDEKAFGPYKGYNDDGSPKTNFEEASWIYKRNGKYYLEYAAGGVPEWMDLSCELSEPIKGIQDLFFTISGSPSSEFKFDNWQFFEESTGIHTPNTTRRVSNVYDLQGRKTKNKPAHHSIQIVDGKKVIQ